MADVYYDTARGLARVPGMKKNNLEEVFAHHVQVQLALGNERRDIANRARAILFSHRHEGASSIQEEQGDVDHYVSLVDDKPDHMGAMAIEFGRGPWRDPDTGEFHPGMDPVAPLGQAAGLTRRRTMPRTPRERRGGGKKRR